MKNLKKLKKKINSYQVTIKENEHRLYVERIEKTVNILLSSIDRNVSIGNKLSRWDVFSLWNTDRDIFDLFENTKIWDEMNYLKEEAQISL